MNVSTVSRSVSARSVPAAAAPLRGEAAMTATIAILQRELDALRQQLEPAPSPKLRLETEQQEALLAALRAAPPSGLWLPQAQEVTGLSKNVTHTRAKQLAYSRRVDYRLEPGPKGRLTVRLRLPEYVAKEY